jgi:2-iminobutanoate/2-iminopropanoate deaminase
LFLSARIIASDCKNATKRLWKCATVSSMLAPLRSALIGSNVRLETRLEILPGDTPVMTRKPAFATSPSNSDIKEIQTQPERKADMPYAPAIRVESPCGLLFISGATPSPLYHKHPHVLAEHDHPNGIEDQTRRAMETIKSILDHEGLTWTDIVKVTKYLTDIRDQDGMVAVMKEYFGSWTPASTTVCINQLSTQGARVELDMIAAFPKGQ